MEFQIGDMIKPINSQLFGIIIDEDRTTKRYRIQWLTSLEPALSWAAYNRIQKVQ